MKQYIQKLYEIEKYITSKFKETAIENNIEGINNKSLSKNIINLTNKVFSTVKDKKKALLDIAVKYSTHILQVKEGNVTLNTTEKFKEKIPRSRGIFLFLQAQYLLYHSQ